jgi:transposase
MFWETIARLTTTRNCFAILEFCTFMGFLHGANRHEEILFPERLDDYITEENPGRFIDAFVDELALAGCGCQRARPAGTGRPGYAPGDLLKLYLYGSLYRLRSSRRQEQATHRHGEVMWLLQKLRPAHKTIADFRQSTLKPLRQVCRPFTLRCKKLDLFGAALVASDGSKCRAVNAKERTFTPDKLKKLLAQIDERVAASLQDLDRDAPQEGAGTSGGAGAEHLQTKSEALPQRKRLYEGLQAQLEASGAAQLSRTEPESRAMKLGKGHGIEVCDNVQTAVDARHTLLIANDVPHETGERAWLSPLALQAKEVLGSTFDAVADVGSYQGEAVTACLAAGLPPYGARPITAAHQKLGLFSKDDVTYEGATDTSPCPAGEQLTFRLATLALGRHIRY